MSPHEKVTMNGVERTLRAFNFETTDRPPIAGGMVQDAEFLASVAGVDDFWSAPRENVFRAFQRLGCDAILGPVMPKPPGSTTIGTDGRPTDFARRHVVSELTSPEEVAEYAANMPTPGEVRDRFDFQAACDEYETRMVKGQAEAGDMLLIPHCLGYAPNFPTSNGHFTYEAFLMACTLYPDQMDCLFKQWGELSRLRCEAVAQVTTTRNLPRLLWIGSDICDARGPVLSPRLFERLYFPSVARAIEPLKDAGMKVIWHADANYKEILPQLLALGIDGFQGFYETEDGILLENLAQMKNRNGEPLILFGSVSTAWVLPRGTVTDVERAVERCMAIGRERGGLLLAPSSSIGPEVPRENITAMYEQARA